MKPAVFLDRDGTVIEHVHHLVDPEAVRLIHGAAQAIARLQARDYACVIVTNQSVIERKKLSVQGLRRVHQVMHEQLSACGVRLDGLYYCPVAPRGADPTLAEHPDRKPGPGMLLRAATEMDLDLSQSWMIGDTISDMLAGRNAQVKGTILVRTGCGRRVYPDHEAVDHTAADLSAAADVIASTAAARVHV